MNSITKITFVSAGLFVILITPAVFAAKPVRGYYFEQTAAGSYNSPGLELTSDVFYRLPLNMGNGELWDSAKVDAGVVNSITPADDSLSIFANIEPIAIFDIGLRAGYTGMFDTFNNGFAPRISSDSSFSSGNLKDSHRCNKKLFRAQAAPQFKIQLGRVIFAHKATFDFIKVRNNPSGYYYEPHNDAILKNKDYTVKNDSYLLCKLNESFMIGGTHGLLIVPSSGYKIQTISAIEIFTYSFSAVNEFSAAFQEGTHLKKRYFRHKLYIAGQIGIIVKL
jgi:hypothetical protein